MASSQNETIMTKDSFFDNDFGPVTDESVLEVGGRIVSSPSELMIETAFKDELVNQSHLIETIHQVDLSHTVLMIESGIIPKKQGQSLIKALIQLNESQGTFKPDPKRGDLYTNREAWLKKATASAGWLGCGRARREVITTAFLIKVRKQLLILSQAQLMTLNTVIKSSEHYMQAVMPDYTYLQSAQPTTFGHFLLSLASGLLRDMDRIELAYEHIDQCPAGCGSTNGTTIPQDRFKLAELMGFSQVNPHCRDAMWTADVINFTGSILSSVMINISRLVEDLIILHSQEFGLIKLSDRHCRASKIMPNKKNPYALTYLRGLANNMIGNTVSLMALSRTPSGQPDNRLTVYGLLPESLDKVTQGILFFNEIMSEMTFQTNQGRKLAKQSQIYATDLAEWLTQEYGVRYREAHLLVAKLIQDQSGHLDKLSVKQIQQKASELNLKISEIRQSELDQIFNSNHSISQKNSFGSCGSDSMNCRIKTVKKEIVLWENWIQGKQEKIEKSHLRLDEKVQSILR